jgi:hypothetical protein
MRFLLYSAVVLIISSCRSDYQGLQNSTSEADCLENFASDFKTTWYAASIDVYGKHMSGLLLVKKFGENYRTVFTNESGVTLLDFEIGENGSFEVRKVIKQLDRKAVIKTLRDDFTLMLQLPFKKESGDVFMRADEKYHSVRQKNEIAYFITDKECASLRRLELGSKRKRKVSILVTGNYDQPTSMEITHHTFDMVIKLKKIERE